MEFCSGVKLVQRPSLKNKTKKIFRVLSEMHDHNTNAPSIPLFSNVALWSAVFTARVLMCTCFEHVSLIPLLSPAEL